MAEVVLRLMRLAADIPTAFDGQWLTEYDPRRRGVSPDGIPMSAHLITTADKREARRFPDASGVYALMLADSGRIRPDGVPDRPLTAFHLMMEPAED